MPSLSLPRLLQRSPTVLRTYFLEFPEILVWTSETGLGIPGFSIANSSSMQKEFLKKQVLPPYYPGSGTCDFLHSYEPKLACSVI